MARRAIEPTLAPAYVLFFLERIGAAMMILGLFTRFIVAIMTFAATGRRGSPGTELDGNTRSGGATCSRSPLRGGGPALRDRKLGWSCRARQPQAPAVVILPTAGA
jgi:hypothetical protein